MLVHVAACQVNERVPLRAGLPGPQVIRWELEERRNACFLILEQPPIHLVGFELYIGVIEVLILEPDVNLQLRIRTARNADGADLRNLPTYRRKY